MHVMISQGFCWVNCIVMFSCRDDLMGVVGQLHCDSVGSLGSTDGVQILRLFIVSALFFRRSPNSCIERR